MQLPRPLAWAISLIYTMELSKRFIEVACDSQSLPLLARSYAQEAMAVEESYFDESYIEFLDEQIRLSPRGPEWTARLQQRRTDLSPYCRVRYLRGVIPAGGSHFTVYMIPEQKVIIHWEEYDWPYPYHRNCEAGGRPSAVS
jgi:hypothetical protein